MTPDLSIVIPIYNAEAYLEETIQSALATDYPSFEIIMVDDGSTDNSYQIASSFAQRFPHCTALTQANKGVCAARNLGIAFAKGKYILPLDADDKISSSYAREAIATLQHNQSVKVVTCEGSFFGDKQGKWHLPSFSLSLLARKNLLPCSCLFYKKDWQRIGGYNTNFKAREDWAFWISLLKDGGEVVRLPKTHFYYRVHKGSKRFQDRKLKKEVTKMMNNYFPAFFEKYLGGPLRSSRTWSKLINKISRFFSYRKIKVATDYEFLLHWVKSLDRSFEHSGEFVFKNRNAIKRFYFNGESYIVKAYQLPHILNRFIYRFFRSTKAERSFMYAQRLRENQIGSPEPIAFAIFGTWWNIGKCFYISKESQLKQSFWQLKEKECPYKQEALEAIAKTTAQMHTIGLVHKDYSPGNILWGYRNGKIEVELIDLNRIRIYKMVSIEQGCENFDRLELTNSMRKIIAQTYATARNGDAKQCEQWIAYYRNKKETKK